MKKMMTNMKTLVALLMAGAAVTSCSSDNEMDSLKAPAGKTYTMTVQATKGGDAMTRALELGEGGKTLTATWATTENVYVKKGGTWATGSLKPQTAGASTTLKGTLSGVTFAVDDELTLQFPKSGDITYAGQKGTLADIAANFDWAIAENVWVTSVDGDGNIDTGENVMEFDHQQAIVRFTLKDKDGNALPSNPTAFTMTDGSSTVELTNIPAETYTTNGGDGVLYVAFPASNSNADITLTAAVGTDTYTCTASSKTFTIGNFYRVTAKMTKQAAVPEGAISGVFSVSATKKVYFSKGNLQLSTANTWKFADNQWDYFGNSQSNNHRDLFGWGTGNNPNQTSEDGDYSTFTDWGTAAASSIGSDWRTLTGNDGGEWEYLFGTNPYYKRSASTVNGTANARFAKGQVNGRYGVILFPDTYSHPEGVTPPVGINDTGNTGWNGNSYDVTAWAKMEAAGCVFLPAAGYREGTSVRFVGDYGGYWSSTAHGSDEAQAHDAYFDSYSVGPEFAYDRYRGFSVRLVRDVE